MNDVPWAFDFVSWVLTSGIGGSLLLLGYLLGFFSRGGRRPKLVALVYTVLMAYAVALVWVSGLMLLGLAGAGTERLWTGFGLGGLVGAASLAWNHPRRWSDPRLAEERRMTALDL
jgi:hypothetical protein